MSLPICTEANGNSHEKDRVILSFFSASYIEIGSIMFSLLICTTDPEHVDANCLIHIGRTIQVFFYITPYVYGVSRSSSEGNK